MRDRPFVGVLFNSGGVVFVSFRDGVRQSAFEGEKAEKVSVENELPETSKAALTDH